MSQTYSVVEMAGTSTTSFAEAAKAAVEEASRSVRHMDWLDVVLQRGRVAEGRGQEFHVTVKVGFKLAR